MFVHDCNYSVFKPVLFSGVIELCRRLGHEAFGEEDDEVHILIILFE